MDPVYAKRWLFWWELSTLSSLFMGNSAIENLFIIIIIIIIICNVEIHLAYYSLISSSAGDYFDFFFGRFPKHQTRLSRSPCVCLMCRINVGVIVTITPVGNQPPQFTADSYTIYVSEGEPVQSSLWRIPVRAIVSIS